MEHDNPNAPARSCSASCRKPCFAGLAARAAAQPAAQPVIKPVPLARDLPPATPQQMLTDDALKLAVLLTAQMFHLTRETVIVAVVAGLPELARLSQVNPLLLARLYAGSRQPLPESIAGFYTRLAESPALRQVLMDDYRATYGGMLDSANRVAGQHAGITDGQAREVLAVLLPAINQVLGRANTGGASEYARRLQDLET